MGLMSWILAGAVAFALARMIPLFRSERVAGELSVAVILGLLAGVTATALDFGGWREPDLRAVLFSFLCSFAACGVVRLMKGREGRGEGRKLSP